MEKLNLNSLIALGALAIQIAVTVITVTASAADIKSDVAVLKTKIEYVQQDQADLRRRIDNKVP